MEQSTEQPAGEPTVQQPTTYLIHIHHDELIQRLDRLIALLEAQRSVDIETLTTRVIEHVQKRHRRL